MPTGEQYLVRLDLGRIRSNLAGAAILTEDDLHRTLAARGVWRHSEEWWGAGESALSHFGAGEIVQKMPRGENSRV